MWDVERRLWPWAGGFIGDNISTEDDGDVADDDDDLVGVKDDFAAVVIVSDDVDVVGTVVAGSTGDGRRRSSLSSGTVDAIANSSDRS
jgi:hypothetical protein